MKKIIIIIAGIDRKSTRLNSSHTVISYAVFCLKKKKKKEKKKKKNEKKKKEKKKNKQEQKGTSSSRQVLIDGVTDIQIMDKDQINRNVWWTNQLLWT